MPKTCKEKLIDIYHITTSATQLKDIPNVKKIIGHDGFYRIKVAKDYRLGFFYDGTNEVDFITIRHRKEIYRYFP